jgi:hypothetical protein
VDFAQAFAVGFRGNSALASLDASSNSMFGKRDKSVVTAWADALKVNTSITELNLAENDMNASDAKILAPAISAMKALSSLNVNNNNIGQQQVRPSGWERKAGGLFSSSKWVHHDGRTQKEDPAKYEGLIALAAAIEEMPLLSKLDLRNNNIVGGTIRRTRKVCASQRIELLQGETAKQVALDALGNYRPWPGMGGARRQDQSGGRIETNWSGGRKKW